ncbi:PTS transporter subunit EIIC [Streptococcus merionis]|uniref:PTS transporter subunit EIIC n=1 Tax=Streptococcus merionis TaxID=400065 RepID=UPI0026F02C73|nr:PTS transporter subunit EIIC [Streptococcus merionis]
MSDKNKQLAQDILEQIGGADNISLATHCMTRLRLNLKDRSLVNDEAVKAIPGVLGLVESGGQVQIVIGQHVPKVYQELTALAGISAHDAIEENLDRPKEKLTLKKVGMNILDYMAGSVTPLIPAMITAAMFKTVLVIIGPDLLNLISVKSDAYVLLNALYNAFFYFLPIYVGFTAAKKLGANQVMGLFAGAMLLVPELVALDGQAFQVYGFIPSTMHNYAQTLLPVLLIVAVMSYLESFFKKIIPSTLATIFVPFLTMLMTVPLAFALLAPLGNILGNWIGNALIAFNNRAGFLATAVLAAIWCFLILTGMHHVLIFFGISSILTNGVDFFVLTAGGMAQFAAFGMAIGAFLRIRDKEEKGLALGYVISGLVGGVTEPTLFGVGMRFKKPFIALAIGGFVGGLYAGITNVGVYVAGATNFLMVLGYVGGGMTNTIHGIIGCLISLGVTAALTYLFGFDKQDPVLQKD